MEAQIENAIAARFRVGVAATNRFVERLLQIVGHHVKRIDPRVKKEFAAELALGIHNGFNFAQLL